MTPPKPPKQYAVYVGKERTFPHKERLVHGRVYQVEISKPNPDEIVWTVLVIASRWRVYVPYPSMRAIWDDWMPYAGAIEE